MKRRDSRISLLKFYKTTCVRAGQSGVAERCRTSQESCSLCLSTLQKGKNVLLLEKVLSYFLMLVESTAGLKKCLFAQPLETLPHPQNCRQAGLIKLLL